MERESFQSIIDKSCGYCLLIAHFISLTVQDKRMALVPAVLRIFPATNLIYFCHTLVTVEADIQ